MSRLEAVRTPADIRALSPQELVELAAEIRGFLIASVSRTGGHLGPNLGVVELTLALHRVFTSPQDQMLFDTGHQSYVHKIITGRADKFDTLRQRHGLSGYPNPAESEHDLVESSHASASLSVADGLAKAAREFRRQGKGSKRTVVALIGDGALTGGMAWEALNNIAPQADLPLVIIVNDNGRSYTPTVGAIAEQLTAMRTSPAYEEVLELIRKNLRRAPLVGAAAYELLHGIKIGLKDVLAPQGLFADLGMKYIGPIDGHNLASLETALRAAKNYGRPVIVHCITQKGHGFAPAEDHLEDQYHAVGRLDAEGLPVAAAAQSWTAAFSEAMLRVGAQHREVVAITAAMMYPTGLNAFAQAWPERTFDVGIAEQHALTCAAGLAIGGLHPVVALYSTFLNRAYDQLLMDCALHQCGVTIALDRSGITGPDGPSHHGMWDISLLHSVPGLQLACPRDRRSLDAALDRAVGISDAVTVVRYSRDAVPVERRPVREIAAPENSEVLADVSVAVLLESADPRVLVIGYGAMVGVAIEVGERLAAQGIGNTVIDPVWAIPVHPALPALAASHELVITIEDNAESGSCGSRLSQTLRAQEIEVPVREFAIPQRFIPHGDRAGLLAELGLTAQPIARYAVETIVGKTEPKTKPDVTPLPPRADQPTAGRTRD